MTIRLQITIQGEGLLDSGALVSLIDRIDRGCRNAAVITTIRIANDFDLPSGLVQLASLRLWAREESFYWIEEVRPGSKKLIGRILAGAVITTVLNNTIGESIKDGWRKSAHTGVNLIAGSECSTGGRISRTPAPRLEALRFAHT
jgi:hypothetical protein